MDKITMTNNQFGIIRESTFNFFKHKITKLYRKGRFSARYSMKSSGDLEIFQLNIRRELDYVPFKNDSGENFNFTFDEYHKEFILFITTLILHLIHMKFLHISEDEKNYIRRFFTIEGFNKFEMKSKRDSDELEFIIKRWEFVW